MIAPARELSEEKKEQVKQILGQVLGTEKNFTNY
jgi:hypothetical protein